MISLDIESQYLGKIIAGVDEAGRGSLVGPVVAASVVVDQDNLICCVNDSKKLSPNKREMLYEQIIQYYPYATHCVYQDEIDRINILNATKVACSMSVAKLDIAPDVVLVDGNMKFNDSRFYSIIKGDTISFSIAAASIVAKVTRDRLMKQLHEMHPEYGWNTNYGYGTKYHLQALKKHGLSLYHRKTFEVYL